jgi:hypothetical protein
VSLDDIPDLRQPVSLDDPGLRAAGLALLLRAAKEGDLGLTPEREARAQAWDEEVELVAEAMFDTVNPGAGWAWAVGAQLPEVGTYRRMAVAALKVIEAERAGEAEVEWQWGFRDVQGDAEAPSERDARRWVSCWPAARTLIRRIPAGQWEPAPAEGGA